MKNGNSGFARLAICASMAAVLAACGGGGSSGSSSSSTSGTGPGPTTTAAAAVMSGTVAIGNALVGASLTITDANGKTVTATSGANGAYTVSIAGLTAPFVITASDPFGASSNLYSIVVNATAANGAPVTANVTPLTTAVSALLTASGNPITLTQAGGLSAVNASTVAAAVATLNNTLAPILAANGLSVASFDPIGGAFTPNQTGADAVIDSVDVRPAANGGGLQMSSVADPNTFIPLRQGATASTTLKNPPQPATYLTPLLAQLTQCMAGPADGSAPACATAIDAHYLSYGNRFQGAHSTWLIGTGTTLTGAKTVAFLPSGTLPGINNPAALVYLLYTQPDGMPNFTPEIVQQLPGGNWDFIGNQEQFNLSIASFVGRVQFTNATEVNNSRYESGLNIQIPTTVYAADGSGSFAVGSALVTGPGLPANGVRMLRSGIGVAGQTASTRPLTFPLATLTATPVSLAANNFSWPDTGMSTQYKWSWAPLSGGSLSFSPSTPDYAAAPVDVSTIQPYGIYTITLFDSSGNLIGTPQKAINTAANMSAVAGATVPWQTLGNDVIANLLTAGGAGTSTVTATSIPSATVDWTVPTTSAVYPNGWASINVQSRAFSVTGSLPFPAAGADDMWFLTTAQSTTTHAITITNYGEQLAPDLPLSNGDSAAQVQLGWQANGEIFTNTWQYDN